MDTRTSTAGSTLTLDSKPSDVTTKDGTVTANPSNTSGRVVSVTFNENKLSSDLPIWLKNSLIAQWISLNYEDKRVQVTTTELPHSCSRSGTATTGLSNTSPI